MWGRTLKEYNTNLPRGPRGASTPKILKSAISRPDFCRAKAPSAPPPASELFLMHQAARRASEMTAAASMSFNSLAEQLEGTVDELTELCNAAA